MKALVDPSDLALPPASKRSGAGKRKRARQAHAMISNTATAMQTIMRDAAEGHTKAYAPAIKLMQVMHHVLQPTPDEAKTGGGPVFSRFGRQTPPSGPPPLPQQRQHPEAAVIDKDGTAYVEAE